VAAAVGISLVALYADYRVPGPETNDRVLHKALVTYVAQHWGEQWPVDPWYPAISGGFPMFAHYQHLSYLAAAALSRALPFPNDPGRVYMGLSYLALALMPAVIYASLRKLGLTAWVAAIAGALYPVLRTTPNFGIGWESYLHAGSGLLPQAWGVLLVFPALAWGYDALRHGKTWTAGVLLGACALSHTLYGYVAALSLCLLVALPDPEVRWQRRLGRLAAVGGIAFATAAYFVVPLVLHAGEVLRSQWEPPWKWDSIGWRGVLESLLRAQVFDGGGWPVLSLLVALGLVVSAAAAVRSRDRLHAWLVMGFVVWTLLFVGRAGWGRAIDLLPLAGGLHMHRFIAGVQIFGLALAAIGLHSAGRAALARGRVAGTIAIVALGAALVVPLAARAGDVVENRHMALARRAALSQDADYAQLIAFLRGLPPGRFHAGMYYDWGQEFRVGDVPLYTLLQSEGLDMVGYLFMAMAMPGEWQVRLDYGTFAPYAVYNARYLVAPARLRPPLFARPLRAIGRYAVYEIPTGGYFALGTVESPAPRPGGDWRATYLQGLDWLHGSGPGEGRYLAMNGGVSAAGPGRPASGRIAAERVSPGRFACDVTADGETDVILKATYHPFWEVSVGGRPAPIVRVFPDFMAVRVPAGSHNIEFRYRPPRWKVALFALSFLTAGIAVGKGVRTLFKGRAEKGS
jgi:hypothetical protein